MCMGVSGLSMNNIVNSQTLFTEILYPCSSHAHIKFHEIIPRYIIWTLKQTKTNYQNTPLWKAYSWQKKKLLFLYF